MINQIDGNDYLSQSSLSTQRLVKVSDLVLHLSKEAIQGGSFILKAHIVGNYVYNLASSACSGRS